MFGLTANMFAHHIIHMPCPHMVGMGNSSECTVPAFGSCADVAATSDLGCQIIYHRCSSHAVRLTGTGWKNARMEGAVAYHN